ncbi:MAG: hypothetical protein HOL01_04260 [Planctomycetaceae bacterium]|nr:hypothetical protein [Planctomycetaceae bacterium]MBT6485397.1 hypothetical protein [Planctomycetaceae bacterium]MBT6493749.1 hypothetical protein [Planctomycetaceae bacterium]
MGLSSAGELRQVLREGLVRKGGLAAIDRQIESVRAQHPGDARLHYIHGLILTGRLRQKDAVAHFVTTIRADKTCGPAWKSLIKIRLVEKSADDLCDELVGLAEALAKTKLDWKQIDRRELAAWLGRVHGFLLLREIEIVSASALEHHIAIVRRRLPVKLHADYAVGRQRFIVDYGAQVADIELAVAAKDVKAAQKATTERKELLDRKQDLDRKAETSLQTQKQWASWLEEQLSTSEKRLETLKEDYQALEAAHRRLSGLRLQTQLDAQRLRFDYSRGGFTPLEIDRQPALLRYDQEIQRFDNERFSLRQQASRVMVTARGVLQDRVAATRRYEKATGDLKKTDATLSRWQKALNRSSLKVEQKAATTNNKKRMLKRLARPATFFELDARAEAEHFLQKLGASLSGKPSS